MSATPRTPGVTGRIGRELRERILRFHGPAPGEWLAGRYRVERAIGAGGMGEVFRAVEERRRAPVAIKILHGGQAESTREHFERQLGLLRRLSHPALVRTHDIGEWHGRPFVVTEYLDGETLKERVRRNGPLGPGEAIRLLVPVLQALEYLHGRGIIHRDVKPQNIMLTPHGVKLLDYGLARRLGIPAREQVGEGTAEYMAPEQVRGGELDHRADLYACAAVLYEMLVGRPPFLEKTPDETALAHLTEPLRFPVGVLRTTPPGLLGLIAVGLGREPGARFRSAAEMRSALKRSTAAGAEGARRLRRLLQREERLARRQRFRQRTLPWLVAVSALGLAAGVWAERARHQVARIELREDAVALHNPWGSELMRLTSGAPVVAAALLDRRPGGVGLVTASAPFGKAGCVTAYRLNAPWQGASVVWRYEAPDRGLRPASLRAVEPAAGAPLLVSRWLDEKGGSRLVVLDRVGRVRGDWAWAGRAVTLLHVERARPWRQQHLWVGGRSDTLGGRPIVVRLSLPDLAPTAWTMLEGSGEIVQLRLAGDDARVRLSGGSVRWLTGLAAEGNAPSSPLRFDASWLERLANPDDAAALEALAAQPDVPLPLATALRAAALRARERG